MGAKVQWEFTRIRNWKAHWERADERSRQSDARFEKRMRGYEALARIGGS